MSKSYLSLLETLRSRCNLPKFPDPLPSKQLDLELENGLTIVIDWDEKTDFVELFSELGTYSSKQELSVLKKIARSNFLWESTAGATLSVRPEIRTVYMALQVPVASLSGDQFVDLVEKFIPVAQQWNDFLGGVKKK